MAYQEENDDVAAYVASLLLEEGQEEEIPGTLAMSFRLPVSLAAAVIVLAEQTGKSRNEMAKLLIKSGLSEVLSHLPAEVREDINVAIHDRAETLL